MNHLELVESLRASIRAQHMSRRTEETYVYWVRRFLQHHPEAGPRLLDRAAVNAFLTHLRQEEGVAASTRNLALDALNFLYRHVLGALPEGVGEIPRARRPRRPPLTFTRREVRCILERLTGVPRIVAAVLYGAGLRLAECLTLRVMDIDFAGRRVAVRDSAGEVERYAPLPPLLIAPLRAHLRAVHALYLDDLEEETALRSRAARAAVESMARSWERQYVFPAQRRVRACPDPATLRGHLDASTVQRALRGAIGACDITAAGCAQALRNSAAAHLLEEGCDIQAVQRLLGHGDVRTTRMYLRGLAGGGA